MVKKFILNLSSRDKAKLEQIRRKNSGLPSTSSLLRRPSAVPPKMEYVAAEPLLAQLKSDEDIFGPVLESLFLGMKRGNSFDKKAAEDLLQSLQYKNVSHSFFKQSDDKYRQALEVYNALLQGSVPSDSPIPDVMKRVTQRLNSITQKLSNMTQRLDSVTQHIVFPQTPPKPV